MLYEVMPDDFKLPKGKKTGVDWEEELGSFVDTDAKACCFRDIVPKYYAHISSAANMVRKFISKNGLESLLEVRTLGNVLYVIKKYEVTKK